MKKSILFLLLLLAISVSAQNKSQYKKIYDYNHLHKDWALVKNIAGTYGFIDRNGKEVVPVIYSKIYAFETKKNGRYALVKNVANSYGFIDEYGREVVKSMYWKKEEAYQKLDLYIKKQIL